MSKHAVVVLGENGVMYRLIKLSSTIYVCEKLNNEYNTYDIIARGNIVKLVTNKFVPMNLLYKAKEEHLFLDQSPQVIRTNSF